MGCDSGQDGASFCLEEVIMVMEGVTNFNFVIFF